MRMQTNAHARRNNARFTSDCKQERSGVLGGFAEPELLAEEMGFCISVQTL